MSFDDTQVKRLKQLLSLLEPDAMTKGEFLDQWKKVVELVKKIEARNMKAIADLEATYKRLESKLSGDNNLTLKELRADFQKQTQTLREADQRLTKMINDRLALLRDGLDGKDADEEAIYQRLLAGLPKEESIAEKIPMLPERVRDALEILQGEERLKLEAIDGLEDKLKELAEIRSKGGNSVGGLINTVRYHDLSDQLDGATKTFNVPAYRVAVQLGGTQHPMIYRPGTDFTLGNKTITLTDEVSAPIAGQSLLFLYVK